MQTNFEHKFKLNQEVYVENNEAGIMKGTITEMTFNVYYDYDNMANHKSVKYIVKTRYKSAMYNENSVFATPEEAFK